ncbi:molecular chaperone TorD family protein [Vibrio scophthalmi]|uniref:TorD/DmsD family molecular chaperone n=1 Tax=Vibrio scophthalmi TaxID=45658 RepID=UPI0030541705
METKMDPHPSPRAEVYLLIATLLRQCPNEPMLNFLRELETEPANNDMVKAWQSLNRAAKHVELSQLEDEFFELFIGIGRGEVVPFASWHLTGSLMEKPLAELRQTLAKLGFERDSHVKEPEDHLAALCEVMAMLVPHDEVTQQQFFNDHIAPWFHRFTEQLNEAKHAQFYRSVAQLISAFLTVEQVRFIRSPAHHTSTRIEVKDATEYGPSSL